VKFKFALALISLFLMASQSLVAQNKISPQGVIDDFDFSHIDDLLQLEELGVELIIFRRASEATVSSAHLALFKKWVSQGGVAYLASDGLMSSLNTKLGVMKPDYVKVQKESGVFFDFEQGVGELFVRDVVPSIQIHPHRITEGVNILYVGPSKETGVYFLIELEAKSTVDPILSLGPVCATDDLSSVYGDSVYKGRKFVRNNGITLNESITEMGWCSGTKVQSWPVLAALSLGKGIIIFDGTGLMIGKNIFEGKIYDWDVFYQNLLDYKVLN